MFGNEQNTVCLHNKFKEQVNKFPESIAIIYGDQKLNYKQLQKAA